MKILVNKKIIGLAIIVVIVVALALALYYLYGCMSDKRYDVYEYSSNHTAAKNVTINMYVAVLGNAPMKILESNSSEIGVKIKYITDPRITYEEYGENLSMEIKVVYPMDIANIPAEIFVYLSNDNVYNFKIVSTNEEGRWKEGSKTTIGNFTGPITININGKNVINK